MMPVLFAVTLFVSATLLFLVQPMIAKMILPKLGGTPAVWNTCMVFFQAALLAGYTYAHVTTTWFGVRRQALIHLVLLLVPLAVLPIAVSADWAPPADANPIPWVLGLLVVSAGLPFFLISTSAPLLQKWFANTGHPSGKDPYFLYAASNLGSMLALIAYPAIMEPSFPLFDQSRYWTVGYTVLVVLTALCAWALWRSGNPATGTAQLGDTEADAKEAATPPTWPTRLHWIALAFVPSSLMLGVTTHISTDIAPIPLIWVVPLGLYLLSFILVFSRLPGFVHQTVVLVLPVLVLLQVFMKYSGMTRGLGSQIALDLAVLFLAAMACHGELARRRPPARYLTGFYLWMSLGGVLGGMFNALIAPLIFNDIIEYYLVLVLACLLLPELEEETEIAAAPPQDAPHWKMMLYYLGRLWDDVKRPLRALDRVTYGVLFNLGLPVLLGYGALLLLRYFDTPSGSDLSQHVYKWTKSLAQWLHIDNKDIDSERVQHVLQYGIPILLCYALVMRPVCFGLGVAAVMLANVAYIHESDYEKNVLMRERSYFGILEVERWENPEGTIYHKLVHGTTLHGMQRCEPEPWADDNSARPPGKPEHNCEALTYYHQTGPIGQLFDTLAKDYRPMAVIGLGTGTLARYAKPGQELTFYEIDSLVVRIARDPRYFSNLTDAEDRGVKLRIQMGDARLSLQKEEDGHYGIILVDAFSSDAIPVHLITREALQLYMRKLAPDGIVVFHISNRYLHLEPVLANLMEAEGLKGGIVMHGDEPTYEAAAATWVPMCRKPSDLRDLIYDTECSDETRLLEVVRMIGLTNVPLAQASVLTQIHEPRMARSWYRLGDPKHDEKTEDGKPVADRKAVGVWSDDYSNILSIFSWKK
jgi:hypothetical protein